MKKLFFMMLIFPFLGNAQTYTVCDCADIMLAMMKEAKGNMTDKDKMEAIKNKYEAKIEKCEKLGDGKSDEEKKKMEEEMKKCPSAKEAEKLMKEMMGEASTEVENNEPNTVCDCADIVLAMMKEAKGNMTDKDKMEAIKNKYETKIEKCEKMSDGKSDEEKKKMEEEMEKCPASKEAEILMKEIIGEYSNKDDDEETRIKKNQERADSFYYKGISKGHHSHRDDYRGAVADFTNAIKLDPKFVEAYCYRGEAKAILNDDMGAMSDFNSALSLFDNNRGLKIMIFAENIVPEIYCMRGSLKNKLGDYRGAIKDLNKALEYNDKYVNMSAFFERGISKSYLKDYKGAMLDYNIDIELTNNMVSYYNRGLLKLEINDKEGACLDFSKAGELGYAKAYELIREHCN